MTMHNQDLKAEGLVIFRKKPPSVS